MSLRRALEFRPIVAMFPLYSFVSLPIQARKSEIEAAFFQAASTNLASDNATRIFKPGPFCNHRKQRGGLGQINP